MSIIDEIKISDIKDLGSKELAKYEGDTNKYALELGKDVLAELNKDGLNLDEEQYINVAIDIVAGVVSVAFPVAAPVMAGIVYVIHKFKVVDKAVKAIYKFQDNEIALMTPLERYNYTKVYSNVILKAGDFSGGQTFGENWMWKLYDVTGGRWSKRSFWGLDGGKPNSKVLQPAKYRDELFTKAGYSIDTTPDYANNLVGSMLMDGIADDILSGYKEKNIGITQWVKNPGGPKAPGISPWKRTAEQYRHWLQVHENDNISRGLPDEQGNRNIIETAGSSLNIGKLLRAGLLGTALIYGFKNV